MKRMLKLYRRTFFSAIMLCLCLAVLSSAQGANVIYVAKSGNDNNTGTSWAAAKQTINGALSATQPGDQVWVAKGTYYEHVWIGQPQALYGGFAGTETDVSQRNISGNPTLVDGGGVSNVFGLGATGDVTLDGLTICHGQMGIGAWNTGTFIMKNCQVIDNVDPDGVMYSGGLQIQGPHDVDIENCTIARNSSSRTNPGDAQGGAIMAPHWGATYGSFTLIGCVIDHNSATYEAGGVLAVGWETVNIENCTVTNNTVRSTNYSVGGLYFPNWADLHGTLTLKNSVISHNSTAGAGIGGVSLYGFTSVSLNQNQFLFNSAGNEAAALIDTCGNVTVDQCLIRNNTGGHVGGFFILGSTQVGVTGCEFTENIATGSMWSKGGLFVAASAHVTIDDNLISGGSGAQSGGLLTDSCSNLTVTRNHILNNTAGDNGGNNNFGGFLIYDPGNSGTVTFNGNEVSGNSAPYLNGYGAGCLAGTFPATFNDNLITNNTGEIVGGVVRYGPAMTVTRCTFTGNQGLPLPNRDAFGALYLQGGGTVANCLIARNTAGGNGVNHFGLGNLHIDGNSTIVNNTITTNSGRGFVAGGGGTTTFTNNIVTHNTAWGMESWGGAIQTDYNLLISNSWGDRSPANGGIPVGAHDLTGSPGFVNRLGGDYHLTAGSPGVNHGSNAAAPGGLDLDGNTRIQIGAVDIGCYESSFALDTVPPVTTVTFTQQPNANGWNNDPSLQIRFDCTDNLNAVLYWSGLFRGVDYYEPEYRQYFGIPNPTPARVTDGNIPDGISYVTFYSVDSALNAEAARTITIKMDHTKPTADPQDITTDEDTAKMITLTGNDATSGIDSCTIVIGPSHGTVTGSWPNLTYAPAPDYNGPDSFTFMVTDRAGNTSTAAVNIMVNPVNDAPVAMNDVKDTPKNMTVLIPVLANDTDMDGDTLSVTSVSTPTKGTVVVNANGTLTYTPLTGVTGVDTFTYSISDGHGGTATGMVTVTITNTNTPPSNLPPDAVNDSFSTGNHKAVTVAPLSNDTDPENDSLSIVSITQPTNGAAVLNMNGTVTYTPNGAFSGNDKFDYTITDGNGNLDTATVTIQVATNANPTAVNDTTSTLSTPPTPRSIDLLANDTDADGDVISLTGFTQPGSGTVTLNMDGKSVTYTPVDGFKGKVTFTYTIADAYGGVGSGTVSITVSTSGAPIAVNDTATTPKDTAKTINVLANDSDPDGDTLSVVSVTQPSNGTAVVNGDGTVTYTPPVGYKGKAKFSYTITDGTHTATATVTVTVG